VDDALSNNAWDPLPDQTVSVTNLDNDAPGLTVSQSSVTVSEDGTTDSWTVVLAARPLSDVILNVSSPDLDEVTVSPGQITFAPDNWDVPQAITATGVNDAVPTVDGNRDIAVTLAVDDALSDNAWDPLADKTVTVTNQDNDAPGFALSKTAATVSENGTTDSFTVVLTARPISVVVFDVARGNPGEVDVSETWLTFTPDNWNVPREVTLFGPDDSPPMVDGNQTVTVTVAVNDAFSGNLWQAVPDQFLTVINLDDDTAGFALSKTTADVSENGTSNSFTVILTAQPLSNVVFDITSSNTSEVVVSPAQYTFTPGKSRAKARSRPLV
jgi:hypothetical protein